MRGCVSQGKPRHQCGAASDRGEACRNISSDASGPGATAPSASRQSARTAGVHWLPSRGGGGTVLRLWQLPSSPFAVPSDADDSRKRGRRRATTTQIDRLDRGGVHLPALRRAGGEPDRTVFGVGPLDPELCFIGEAPAATEDSEANRSSARLASCSTASSLLAA